MGTPLCFPTKENVENFKAQDGELLLWSKYDKVYP